MQLLKSMPSRRVAYRTETDVIFTATEYGEGEHAHYRDVRLMLRHEYGEQLARQHGSEKTPVDIELMLATLPLIPDGARRRIRR